jgi:hypothetical protein
MSENDSGPDILSSAERHAIRQRQYLRELLRDTCIHLHAPEACMWCIEKQLNTAGPERGEPNRDLMVTDHEGTEHRVWDDRPVLPVTGQTDVLTVTPPAGPDGDWAVTEGEQ